MILIVYKPSGVINVGTTFSQRGGEDVTNVLCT